MVVSYSKCMVNSVIYQYYVIKKIIIIRVESCLFYSDIALEDAIIHHPNSRDGEGFFKPHQTTVINFNFTIINLSEYYISRVSLDYSKLKVQGFSRKTFGVYHTCCNFILGYKCGNYWNTAR